MENEESGARGHHPIVYGLLSMAAMLLPLGLLFWSGIQFTQWYWNHPKTTEAIWQMPYLTGICVGLLCWIVITRLERTRVAYWFAWFETWTETLSYPVEADSNE